MNSPEVFKNIVEMFSYRQGNSKALTNLTFFLGAGFSKAWAPRFPTGNELFTIDADFWDGHTDHLGSYLASHGYPGLPNLTPPLFKEIVYQLGMYKKYPDIRPRYIDGENIKQVESELRALVIKKFEQTSPLERPAVKSTKFKPHPLTKSQKTIVELFSELRKHIDGSNGIPEGIRTNFITTNYDFTLEYILDSILSPDDHYPIYTYRGISPKFINGIPNPEAVHDHHLVQSVLKINGGFEIYKSSDSYNLDYYKKTSAQLKAQTPEIMLPSKEQDYTQDYFKAVFPKAIRLLQESKILIIVGYSIPDEDSLFRFLLKQFSEDKADGDGKAVFYVDLSPESEQIEKIKSVFPHYEKLSERGLNLVPYSGTFNNWANLVIKSIKRPTATKKRK